MAKIKRKSEKAQKLARRFSVDKLWFQGMLADKGYSQRGYAKIVGMDPPALHYSLEGKREFKPDELNAFAALLRLNPLDVYEKAGVPLPEDWMASVPAHIVGTIGAGGEFKVEQVDAPKRAPLPPDAPKNLIAARLKTLGSAAEAMDGWLVYFVDSAIRVPPEAVGRVSVAWLGNKGKSLVGILRRGYQRGTYTLQPWIPGAELVENVIVERASPVLWIRTSV